MIKPGDHTVQIAVAVLASVEPRPDIHLIEHGAVPPAVLGGAPGASVDYVSYRLGGISWWVAAIST